MQEIKASRLGSKTKVVFTLSPGLASMPPALQFVYVMLVLLAEGSGLRLLVAAPNQKLEPVNSLSRKLRRLGQIVSRLEGLYELAGLLIVLDEVLHLEISNLARQLKPNTEVVDNQPAANHLTVSLCFRSIELTITGSISSARGPINNRKNVAGAEK